MNSAVTADPTRSPMTEGSRSRRKPAAPVNPSSARACTAKAMLRATTKRLTRPQTTATTIPAAIAFCTKS